VRVDERVTSGDTHAVAFSQSSEDLQVGTDLFQRPMTFRVSVTPLTSQIAYTGRLQPGNAVIRVIPWKPVVLKMIQFESHVL
jgi:hypothetical protein